LFWAVGTAGLSRPHPFFGQGHVGSNIFNLLGILGITAMATPLAASGISLVDYAVMAVFALVLWPMAYHQKRITRLEGAILLASYAAYVSWLVLST